MLFILSLLYCDFYTQSNQFSKTMPQLQPSLILSKKATPKKHGSIVYVTTDRTQSIIDLMKREGYSKEITQEVPNSELYCEIKEELENKLEEELDKLEDEFLMAWPFDRKISRKVSFNLGDIIPQAENVIEIKTKTITRIPKLSKCDEYSDIFTFAERFVEDIINKSSDAAERIQLYRQRNEELNWQRNEELKKEVHKLMRKRKTATGLKSDDQAPGKFQWPTIAKFTPDGMCYVIDDYLDQLHFKEDWAILIKGMSIIDEEFSVLYKYEVLCCLPTILYPIAQATVSIYFHVEISKSIPENCPIIVKYNIESFRSLYDPDRHPVREDVLLNVIRAKLKYYKTFTF